MCELTDYVLMRNQDLLIAAKEIFGNYVIDAFEAEYHSKLFTKLEDTINLLNKRKFKRTGSKQSSLNWDSKCIVLVFNNGREVLFSNSEWADMELTNISTAHKII